MNDSYPDTALDVTLAAARRRTDWQLSQWDAEAQLAKALESVREQNLATRSRTQPVRFRVARLGHPSRGRFLRWGMLSLGAVAASVAIVWTLFLNDGRTPASVPRQYITTTAQSATLGLSDGSRVTLAPESRLQFHTDANGRRIVNLLGQARFVVMHDPDHPFVVATGKVATTVLGTEFDVASYTDDAPVQVAVLAGKVVAAGQRSSITLTPGWVADITDSTAVRNADADIASVVGWTNGRLAFTRAAVPTVLESIGRWYGYEFKLVDSSLAKRHVSVELSVNDRVETLQLLRELLNVTTHVQGNVIVLQPNTSSSAPPARQSERSHLQLSNEVGK